MNLRSQVLVSFHLHKAQHRFCCPGIKLHLVLLRDEIHLGSEELDPCEAQGHGMAVKKQIV